MPRTRQKIISVRSRQAYFKHVCQLNHTSYIIKSWIRKFIADVTILLSNMFRLESDHHQAHYIFLYNHADICNYK
jgi:hypothetical protein